MGRMNSDRELSRKQPVFYTLYAVEVKIQIVPEAHSSAKQRIACKHSRAQYDRRGNIPLVPAVPEEPDIERIQHSQDKQKRHQGQVRIQLAA